jgi:ribosomal protein S20
LARTPRKWQGARTPSGLKRVRQAERRHAILQPRRSTAKTLVAKSLTTATVDPTSAAVATSLSEAISALDRAAKAGAIHPNAAARRKSRLARKVNAAVGGAAVVSLGHVAKSTGKAAAVKAAKARIAAGKAVKAKGAQTAAGKARAALSKSTRADTAHAAATTEAVTATTTTTKAPAKSPAKAAAKAAAKPAAKAATKTTAAKSTTTTAKATTAKAAAPKATAAKATAAKTTTTKAAPKTTKAKKAE